MSTKAKGDYAELAVATDLARQGYKVAFPFGDGWASDVLITKDEVNFFRVQVKYVEPRNGILLVRCYSTTFQAGRQCVISGYGGKADVIAAYDPVGKKCYYIPVEKERGATVSLRLIPPNNGQKVGVRFASDYENLRL